TMSLYVHETGTAGASSVVFLHGAGTSGWMWEKQIAALADFHCLNVDLPGHGKSNHITWVSLKDTADQIAAIIQEYATNGRAHIVGLSLGGYIVLALLEHYTDLLDHVIMSGVTVEPIPNRRLLTPQLWLMSAVVKRRWLVNMQAKLLHLSPEMQAAFAENLQAMSMQAYRRIAEEVVLFHISPALRQVNTPTLVVAGGNESKIITQAVGTISAMMPNAQGRLAPGCGHGWNVEAPDLFNTMIRAWITDKPLPHVLQTVIASAA
ncbi:MAG: alpha/beta hydrolase, partial [Anaerolineae bacterium]|nr:alpha/beta hydrolase [Anaerolineae bacterium]